MIGPCFYRPVERGLEIRIAEKMRQMKALNELNGPVAEGSS